MEIKAKLKNLRIAPRKVRLVADLIRGKGVDYALYQLKFSRKRASNHMLKLLNSAISNAKNNLKLTEEQIKELYVFKITVNEGQKLKRQMPRARGRANLILKRSSHINLILKSKIKDQIKNFKFQTPDNR